MAVLLKKSILQMDTVLNYGWTICLKLFQYIYIYIEIIALSVSIYIYIYIYTAAARVMQSSSNELSILVSGKV